MVIVCGWYSGKFFWVILCGNLLGGGGIPDGMLIASGILKKFLGEFWWVIRFV